MIRQREIKDLVLIFVKAWVVVFLWWLAFEFACILTDPSAISATWRRLSPIFSSAFVASLGSLCIVMLIGLKTKGKKNDPFRFSRRLEAFFHFPESIAQLDFNHICEALAGQFHRCKLLGDGECHAIWWMNLPNGIEPNGISRVMAQERSITIRSNAQKDRVEVHIEPAFILKFFDTKDANSKALEDLMRSLRWEHFRVPVDRDGHPNWKDGAT